MVRQPEAAYDNEAFRRASARAASGNVLAHIRRATVGRVCLENTHPFAYGAWLLAHNGHLGSFDAIRPRLLRALRPEHRAAIQGNTDSEHLFYLFLSLITAHPDAALMGIVRRGVRDVIRWSDHEDSSAEVVANIVLTDGVETVGLRYGRTLKYVERDRVHACEVCDGELHIQPGTTTPYRAVVVASEPVTKTETWSVMPEATLFHIDSRETLRFEPL